MRQLLTTFHTHEFTLVARLLLSFTEVQQACSAENQQRPSRWFRDAGAGFRSAQANEVQTVSSAFQSKQGLIVRQQSAQVGGSVDKTIIGNQLILSAFFRPKSGVAVFKVKLDNRIRVKR